MVARTPLLVASAVDKSFGKTRALAAASLSAERGEVHALLGENGAGKSTLMMILAGALTADGGSMQLLGKPYQPNSPIEAERAGVAMVHQEPQLCPQLTVAENISLGNEPERWGWLDRPRLANRAREALAKLAPDAGIEPHTLAADLSPGDRQLVAIARAVSLGNLRLLILDEPTSSLSARDAERLFEVIARLRADGRTILYISHFLEEVERIADRFTVLRDGTSVGAGKMAQHSLSELVTLMVGHAVEDAYPRSPHNPGDVLLELADVAGARLPQSSSLMLRAGEVLGLAGLVGSGRTELLRVLFGLDALRSGRLQLGVHQGWAPPSQRLAQGVGMVSEDRKEEGLAGALSIAENLTLSKLTGLGPRGLVWPSQRRQAAERWVERLAIVCRDVDQPISDLSGGNQQKVAIARLLYHDVDILLLDEPTRGIDIKSRAAIYRLIDELAVAGKTVLLVSSYLPELLGICDRIAVMRRGVLGPARAVAEVTSHDLLSEATGA